MTNQEKLAREWATKYLKWNAYEDSPELHAVAELVLANTKPATMADVEWEDSEHFLAGATANDEDEEIMLTKYDGQIITASLDDPPAIWIHQARDLTPNGKRYELREAGDDQPERPKVLCTVEDYGNAPVGTIAAINGYDPIIKGNDGWGSTSEGENTSEETARRAVAERKILRLGWNG
mgnify:CR=1 FL=1